MSLSYAYGVVTNWPLLAPQVPLSPIFADTTATLAHVLTQGTTLIDTVAGNVWVMSGTVPFGTASNSPVPFGPFSNTNYFYSGTGNDSLDASLIRGAIVYEYQPGTNNVLFSNGVYGIPGQGYEILNTYTSGAVAFSNWGVSSSAFNNSVNYAAATVPGSIHIICFGYNGTTTWLQLDNIPISTLTSTWTPGTANQVRIGAYPGTGVPSLTGSGRIYEIILESSAPSSASFSSYYTQAKARLGGLIP